MKNLLNKLKDFRGIISTIVGGIIAGIGVFTLRRASAKKEVILKEFKEVEDVIEECSEKCDPSEYSDSDKETDKMNNTANMISNIILAYCMPFILIISGILTFVSGLFIFYNDKFMNKEMIAYEC